LGPVVLERLRCFNVIRMLLPVRSTCRRASTLDAFRPPQPQGKAMAAMRRHQGVGRKQTPEFEAREIQEVGIRLPARPRRLGIGARRTSPALPANARGPRNARRAESLRRPVTPAIHRAAKPDRPALRAARPMTDGPPPRNCGAPTPIHENRIYTDNARMFPRARPDKTAGPAPIRGRTEATPKFRARGPIHRRRSSEPERTPRRIAMRRSQTARQSC
jgi:hypothetical protein